MPDFFQKWLDSLPPDQRVQMLKFLSEWRIEDSRMPQFFKKWLAEITKTERWAVLDFLDKTEEKK